MKRAFLRDEEEADERISRAMQRLCEKKISHIENSSIEKAMIEIDRGNPSLKSPSRSRVTSRTPALSLTFRAPRALHMWIRRNEKKLNADPPTPWKSRQVEINALPRADREIAIKFVTMEEREKLISATVRPSVRPFAPGFFRIPRRTALSAEKLPLLLSGWKFYYDKISRQ